MPLHVLPSASPFMTEYSTQIKSEYRFLLNAAAGPLRLIDPIGLADLLNYARDNGEVQVDMVLDELTEYAYANRHCGPAHKAWSLLLEGVAKHGIHNGEVDHLEKILRDALG